MRRYGQMPDVAKSTHDWSHARVQQLGSILHTTEQHVNSLQNGVGCGFTQLPASGDPHWSGSPQSQDLTVVAMFAHWMSHVTVQQIGSCWQTASQQSSLAHAALSCGAQQFPAPLSPHWGAGHAPVGPPQRPRAEVAQAKSHLTSQQIGSCAQTAVQHAASLHAGLS